MTLRDIKQAIAELSPSELDELYVWFDEHYLPQMDNRLKADLDGGRFDEQIDSLKTQSVKREIEKGWVDAERGDFVDGEGFFRNLENGNTLFPDSPKDG